MLHHLFYLRESTPGLGLTSTGPLGRDSLDAAAALVQHPSTIVTGGVFALVTLVGLKALFSGRAKAPILLAIFALVVGSITAYLASQGVAVVQGYRPLIDGFAFGVAMLVAILYLGPVIYPGNRNIAVPKGAAISAGVFFLIYGLSSIPEVNEIFAVRIVLVSLAGTLCLASGILINSYVSDGLLKLAPKQPGGVKLLMLSAWFWLFYPLTGIISMFMLSPENSLFVYNVVHAFAVSLSAFAVFLFRPCPNIPVVEPTAAVPDEKAASPAVPASAATVAPSGSSAVQPVAPPIAPSPAAANVVRKAAPAKPVIGRPVRPSKPTPPPSSPGSSSPIPKAPPPPKPKRR